MKPTECLCTDPSHPPIYRESGQSLFGHVTTSVADLGKQGLSEGEIVRRVSNDVIGRLDSPLSGWMDGYGVQDMRRIVANSWRDIFLGIDNLGFLVGWFINECAQEKGADELHYALCHLAFESNRSLFVVVSQLRSALANDTFPHLRVIHETVVKSRFLKKYTSADPDLPARFFCLTNAVYMKLYCRFAKIHGRNAAEGMWMETDQKYKDRVHSDAGGPYAWAYPLVVRRNGKPKKSPQFIDLKKDVDPDSTFSKLYYDVATEKAHGRFIWNPVMVRPDPRVFRFDPFDPENTGLVLDLMLPMYGEVIESTASCCLTPGHTIVVSVIKTALENLRNTVRVARASNSEFYGRPDRP